MSTSIPKQTHYDVLHIAQTATADEIKAAYRSLIIECHPDKLTSSSATNNKNENCCNDVHIIVSEGLSAIDIDDDDGKEEDDTCNHPPRYSHTKSETSNNMSESSSKPIQSTTKEEAEESSKQTESLVFHQIQTAFNCLRDPTKRRQYDEHISRKEEREKWKWKGAIEVNLSEMESDWCCVVDDASSEEEEDVDGDTPLQKVFFHPCRCGDNFSVIQDELLQSIDNTKCGGDLLTNRVWQCDSCSLTIRIYIDIKVSD